MIINIQIYHFQHTNCVLIKNYERYCVEKFSKKKKKKNTILFVCRIKKKFHLSTCSIDKKKSCNNSLLISTCYRLSIDFAKKKKKITKPETSKKKDIYRYLVHHLRRSFEGTGLELNGGGDLVTKISFISTTNDARAARERWTNFTKSSAPRTQLAPTCTR